MAFVYKHIRNDKNEVFYIGISDNKDGKYKRSLDEVHRNKFWKNITNKTSFTCEVIFDNISWEEAKKIEIELIEKYGLRFNKTGSLCNLTLGGEGSLGLKWDDERREKIMSKIVGKKRTQESKDRMSKSRAGRILTLSHKNNISKTLKSKEWSGKELEDKRNASAKIVINEQSGIFYSSAKEAAFAHNINTSTLYNKLVGLKRNNTYLRYVNE